MCIKQVLGPVLGLEGQVLVNITGLQVLRDHKSATENLDRATVRQILPLYDCSALAANETTRNDFCYNRGTVDGR